ncbi:MAG: glycosyltransferase family 2 protein [Clostridiales bacterium]|nr:glycosyltransferase family 2 protein [Clostridiales bacterium]MDD6492184.1 glycosyltransferase family 2 protein [Bacillota bacterium]
MKTIYLVLPCYNEELVINDSAVKLKQLMSNLMNKTKITNNSKIIFVDDGSIDTTWNLLENICQNDDLFGAIRLAHNTGHQNALLAGMMAVKDLCDAVITLDADLQHDINAIPRFIELFEEGYDIVNGIRKSRSKESFFKKLSGDMFYNLMNLFGAKIIKNHADYRLLSSRALNALAKYEEVNLFLRGIIPQIGFKSTTLEYEEKPRLAGESKYSLSKMLKLAADGITSFSIRPLQLITVSGILFFVFSIIMFIYAIVAYAQNGTVPGWTSIVAPLWLIGGIQLLALGIVGEYIGKIYLETKHRPRYEIAEMLMTETSVH